MSMPTQVGLLEKLIILLGQMKKILCQGSKVLPLQTINLHLANKSETKIQLTVDSIAIRKHTAQLRSTSYVIRLARMCVSVAHS